MKLKMFAAVAVILVLALSAFAVFALGPAPSWQLTAAPAGVCTDDDIFIPGVEINVPAPMFASESGTLSAPGFPGLGYTQDTNFQGVGTFGFTVFTDPFVLPANTPLTLSITTYAGPNYTGGAVYVSTMTWDCTTGVISSLVNGIPDSSGCAAGLPSGAVMGHAPNGAQIYGSPAAGGATTNNLNPGTYYVIGVDATGEYSKVWLTCTSQFWVRSDTLQPSYQAPWNGQPLPTNVVS